MPFLIVLALLALPFAEIAVFIAVGRQLGVWATLGLTVLISLIGLSLVAGQGLTNLRRLQITLNAGEPPVAELVHGVLLFIAGFCLFIPGFITDAAGALLLLPPVRAWLGRAFLGVDPDRPTRPATWTGNRQRPAVPATAARRRP